MAKLVKRCALTKINSVTVGTERPRPRMRNICSSPKYAAGGWNILVSFVRAPQEGNFWQAGGNLVIRIRPGLEPTVRIDICESAAFYQLCHKSNLRFADRNWIQFLSAKRKLLLWQSW
jgi:hypothetical protein